MTQLIELLYAFFQIGLFSIGGGYAIIPMIQDQVVRNNGWVSQQVFTDIITISQMTPGPLAVNTSTFIGIQIAGIPGAVVATFGCVISGILISTTLYCIFKRFRSSTFVMDVLNGLKAASLGLILSASATILLLTFTGSSQLKDFSGIDWGAFVIFSALVLLLRKVRINPILIMVLTGISGLFL